MALCAELRNSDYVLGALVIHNAFKAGPHICT